MRDEIANLVYPVLSYGTNLMARLAEGDFPPFAETQKQLQGLLFSGHQSHGWEDVTGDNLPADRPEHFLGIRYALVCWLDEVFIADSAWRNEWAENKLEQTLYGTNDRAWRFWEQARLAESRPKSDALEAFYLCVMLGFRGELQEQPGKLKTWCDAAKAQIQKGQQLDWPGPVEGQPRTFLPELGGASRMQRMMVIGAAVLLVVIPVSVFFLAQLLQ